MRLDSSLKANNRTNRQRNKLTMLTRRSNGRFPPKESGSFHRVKSSVLEPFRVLCEYNHINFFVVVQPSSSSSSSLQSKRYWSSSEQMSNFCGDLINGYATYVDISAKNDAIAAEVEAEEDLKIDVEEAIECEDSFEGNMYRWNESVESGEECVLLPEQIELDEEEEEEADEEEEESDGVSKEIDDGRIDKRHAKVYLTAKREECDNNNDPGVTSDIDRNRKDVGSSPSLKKPDCREEKTNPQHGIRTSNLDIPTSTIQNGSHLPAQLPNQNPAPATPRITVAPKSIPLPTRSASSSSATRPIRLLPPLCVPPPDAETCLEDDLLDSESPEDGGGGGPQPTIWKRHEFEKPLRSSTVKELFTDKLLYSKK